ncbi:hypothetical protein [Acinetobacter genomosp. 15BJ]|uniref:PilC beta-propeller domain-containing protein n=1 Tax=Acinetobacter genomosp. 15BJ TaxID=106651 RepID=R9ATU0_9GAMM|nr:hypothetical protein [Acinetobacter genomosp. 15BJ]EOR05632.1 hypothetical protein F896_03058 [Acinetobacter genomosp. 15BJ]MCH7290893.1 hypothetical protein [Acinetobacter genomosp. 15BJ]MDO3655941.1 hypothetical protein [Acinetobacter genomosp. 15BJ]
MTRLTSTVLFKRTVLASFISLCVSQSIFALQEISDDVLSETTGEGIAFLPRDFSFRFNGAENPLANGSTPLNFTDTGYIRYIPVGPLTQKSLDTNKDGIVSSLDRAVGKADLFLYGLALSKANGNANNRFNNTSGITSWGTATNPWILKVATESGVPTFTPDDVSGTTPVRNTDTGAVTYLALEAPLFNKVLPTNAIDGADAYNLKLGLWADAFVRNPNVAENMAATGNQFNLGELNGTTDSTNTRANRLRLNAVWDGFGINGSRIQIFQTLGGSNNTGGMSKFYNETLGLNGILRLNSGPSDTLRATATANAVWVEASPVATNTYTVPTALATIGAAPAFASSGGCGVSGTSPDARNLSTFSRGDCIQNERILTRTSRTTTTWGAPTTGKILRIGTQETTDSNILTTPAINGGTAPVFREPSVNDGAIYIYNLNTNLVLGSLYQPLVLGVADDGRNVSLEIARIPNKESIYKKIYTNYSRPVTASDPSAWQFNGGYYGSTCNVHYCGEHPSGTVTSLSNNYQGSSATHSSITIGSTVYNSAKNELTAYSGAEAVGISFGALQSGTVVNDQQYKQVQQQNRNWTTGYERYCSGGTNWLGSCQGYSWRYFNQNWQAFDAWKNVDRTTYSNNINITSPRDPILNPNGGIPTVAPVKATAPSNNFGSAAIDGLLIQHLKMTTTGL